MRRTRVFVVVVGLVGVFSVASAIATTTTMSWGKEIPVPGLQALNSGGSAAVASVSCRSAKNCTAGGFYYDHYDSKAFVVDEKAGAWGTAIAVPGLAALANGGDGTVNSISCGSVGNCVAGGSYYDTTSQAFVADETAGVWGNAIEVPGVAALNTAGSAGVGAASCSSAGNCAAAGYYEDAITGHQAFVVGEASGVWGTAIPVPGLAALNTGGNASLNSISCRAASPGNCSAGGYYSDGMEYQAFVVSEKNGVWGTAIEVPGIALLNSSGDANVSSVSCTSAGNCAAGGHYEAGGGYHAFVVTQKNGVWGTAIEVPGLALLNSGSTADVTSVACTSAGNCAAGGYYRIQPNGIRAFVVTEKNGVWKNAIQVPGAAALLGGANYYMAVRSVSCATAGNCLAGGIYVDGNGVTQAFIVVQTSGTWRNAIELPGSAALNVGGFAAVNSISCVTSGRCSVAGGYGSDFGRSDAFVTP